MFTQPCFIRKNTKELIEKLEELGYSKNSPSWTDKCSIIWCYQYSNEKGFDTPQYVIANSFDIPFDEHSSLCGKFIDCGTNEQLFLALAALRDDTDRNQWFIYDSMDAIIESARVYEWFVCNEDRIEDMLFYDCHYLNTHKATVEELIEFFKDR